MSKLDSILVKHTSNIKYVRPEYVINVDDRSAAYMCPNCNKSFLVTRMSPDSFDIILEDIDINFCSKCGAKFIWNSQEKIPYKNVDILQNLETEELADLIAEFIDKMSCTDLLKLLNINRSIILEWLNKDVNEEKEK